MDDIDYAYEKLDAIRNLEFPIVDAKNYSYSAGTKIIIGYSGTSTTLELPNSTIGIIIPSIPGMKAIIFNSDIQFINSSTALPASLSYIRYKGTKAKWENIMANLGSVRFWKNGSTISKVICSDGELALSQ